MTIPPEVTPENVTTTIVDTSSASDAASRAHLLGQLVRAHVICLVYSISEPATFERVAEYWLPLFRREGVNVSIGASLFFSSAFISFPFVISCSLLYSTG